MAKLSVFVQTYPYLGTIATADIK